MGLGTVLALVLFFWCAGIKGIEMGLFRVLVCGGRDFDDFEHLCTVMDRYNPKGFPVSVEICQGGARGADNLAKLWASLRGVRCIEYPADWATHGKAAGPIRNQQMLDDFGPQVVVAFPGGRGTDDMIRRAEKAGVPVLKVKEKNDSTSKTE